MERQQRRSSRRAQPSARYGQEFEAFRNPARPEARQEPSTSAAAAAAAAVIVPSPRPERVSRALAAVDRPENRPDFEERGQTRSGARFASRNLPHFTSMRELLSHHQRLLEPGPVVSTRYVQVGRGVILQTCVRFRSDHPNIRGGLVKVLIELFRELENSDEGLEVTITFNAILADKDFSTFSLFYGQDYGEQSQEGAHSKLGFSKPVIVRNLLHLRRIPTEFDLEDLVQRFSLAFESSNIVVARLLNVVYLIHHYRDGN